MKKSIIFLLLVLTINGLQAQTDTASKQSNINTLKSNEIYVGCCGFLLNNHKYNKNDIISVLSKNPKAMEEYRLSQKSNAASNIMGIITFSAWVAGLATIGQDNNISGKIFSVSLVPIFFGVHLNNKRDKHYFKAIDIYNKTL